MNESKQLLERMLRMNSIDSMRFVHKRIRWGTHSDRIAKALTSRAGQEEINQIVRQSAQTNSNCERNQRLRWVDVNKRRREQVQRSMQICGKELKAKTMEAFLADELFSPMPPWEKSQVLYYHFS